HPVVLGAILVLVLNDQVLKRAWPGVTTGKLSDVAGLVFAPLVLVAVAELLLGAPGRWDRPSRRMLTIAVGATGLGFAAVKLIPGFETAWEAALGAIQWPASAIGDLLAGRSLPPIRPVVATPDVTDLVALPAIWIAHTVGLARVNRGGVNVAARAAGMTRTWWYELGVAGLGVAMLAGATVDGWAHTHDPNSLETIFTPWHAIVYASFSLVAFLVFAPSLAARLEGRNPVGAIPAGFGWSVVGVVAFGLVGLLDLAWHVAFGLEADTEALLSPTHLGLGVTSALIASGPLRAAWQRPDERPGEATWPSFLPPILAVVAIAGVAAFALHPLNLFVDAWPRWPYSLFDATWYGPNIGIAGAIVPTVILMIPLLELLRRWPDLPAGTATLLSGGTMAGLTFLHDGQVLIGAPVLGGVLVDLAILALRSSPLPAAARPGARSGMWPIAALAPGLLFAAYFLVVSRTGPVTWTAHLIGGTIVLTAITGLALALLARHPKAARAG
ncbi:MAG: hypothetical protein H0V73_01260, partial [Chloroflexi bacterium]|nr:hypothetical protein [Chloroflexota bacterium]